MIFSIRSRANAKVKLTMSLKKASACRKRNKFLMEGPKFIADHIARNGSIDFIIVSKNASDKSKLLAQTADKQHYSVIEVPKQLFSEISDTSTPQGIAAVCSIVKYDTADIFDGGTVLVLDKVSDPGNAGTAIRSAAAFNCSGVIFLKGSAFPYNPKVTRSAAGLNSVVPIYEVNNLLALKENNSNYSFLGAQANSMSINSLPVEFSKDLCIVIGSETHGLSEATKEVVNDFISIPMTANVESLNAGVSASIILFSLFKKSS